MKNKISIFLIVCLLLLTNFSPVFARVEEPPINSIPELHEYIISNHKEQLQIRDDGKLDVSEIDIPSVDANLLNEYKDVIDSVNKTIDLGVVKYDSNYEVDLIPEEERTIPEAKEESSPGFSMLKDPDEPLSFPLVSKVNENVDTLKMMEADLRKAAILNPKINPWLETAIQFALRVRPNGEWDYKVAIGWNKTRTVIVSGKKYYIDGEDIGNIHYGYVGRYLFDGTTLLKAGGVVQRLQGRSKPEWFATYYDDPKDYAAVSRGINWYNSGIFK